MNFIRLNQVFLPVTNLSSSTEWYRENFNMKQVWSGKMDHKNAAELAFHTSSFFLIEQDQVNHYTHIPFNFHTNNIRQLHDSLTQKGITVTEITNDDGMLCCDFYDIEGNRLGLVHEAHHDASYIEMGGTFLTVRQLDRAEKLGYDFQYYQATGAAGVIGPTPAYIPDLTIYYAGVTRTAFQVGWSRLSLVETPQYIPLVYKPYNILSSNIEEDCKELLSREVLVTDIKVEADHRRFSFFDMDENEIEIIEHKSKGGEVFGF
jgi:catechol 2,3-dioxygenase-like lactoylglutathione lyase family enzyme